LNSQFRATRFKSEHLNYQTVNPLPIRNWQ